MQCNRTAAAHWSVGAATIGISMLWVSVGVRGDEPPPPKGPEPPKRTATSNKSGTIVTDQFDTPVAPLKPAKPRSAKEKSREEALAWFMSGRLKQAESRFTEALSDYQAAIKIDPRAVEVYRALVPLAFALNETEKGLQYGQKAIELDPDDLDILRILADQLQREQKNAKAAEYLDRATRSPKLTKDSATYVLLQLQLATLCVEMGKLDKAADAYTIVFDARKNPTKYNLDFQTRSALDRERVARYEVMGEIFLMAQREKQAVEAFEEAAKGRNGKAGSITFSLAQAYFRAKQYDAALKHLQAYLDAQLQGRGRRPYELLNEILKKTGKTSELLPRLDELAKRDPRNAALQYFLADQYAAAGRTADAEALIKRMLKESGDPEGYVSLAVLYRRGNKPAELLDAMSKALKGLKSQQGIARLDSLLAEMQHDAPLVDRLIAAARSNAGRDKDKPEFFMLYLVGRLAAKAQRSDAAIEFYTQAIAIRRDIAGQLADELGKQLVLAKRYQQAADFVKKAIAEAAFPSGHDGERLKLELLALLSRAQELAGQTKEALASIHEAEKIAVDEPELEYWEAWIFSHSHQWDEAIRRYHALIKKHSSHKEFIRRCQFTLSNCLVQRGDIAAGEKILEGVLVEQPNDPSVNNDLGYLYADQGKNLARAETMIRAALKSEPDNVAYIDSLGWVLFKRGRVEEARGLLEKAVGVPTGSDATIWEHLGDCYERLKLRDKATDAWKKAIKEAKDDAYPDSKLIKRLDEKLKTGASESKK